MCDLHFINLMIISSYLLLPHVHRSVFQKELVYDFYFSELSVIFHYLLLAFLINRYNIIFLWSARIFIRLHSLMKILEALQGPVVSACLVQLFGSHICMGRIFLNNALISSYSQLVSLVQPWMSGKFWIPTLSLPWLLLLYAAFFTLRLYHKFIAESISLLLWLLVFLSIGMDCAWTCKMLSSKISQLSLYLVLYE